MTGFAHTLNDPADALMRTALRDAISRLLNNLDFPGKQAQAGRKWLEQPGRSVQQLSAMKDRTLEVLQEARSTKQLKAEREAQRLEKAA